jgi:predicted DNA-binding protein
VPDTIHDHLSTLETTAEDPIPSDRLGAERGSPRDARLAVPVRRVVAALVATRQTSSSGRPKSPRIQVVLPEALCERLTALADADARTVSNMARVLIQQGVERLERQRLAGATAAEADSDPAAGAERFRRQLERQEQADPRRLRGAPRRLRLQRPR